MIRTKHFSAIVFSVGLVIFATFSAFKGLKDKQSANVAIQVINLGFEDKESNSWVITPILGGSGSGEVVSDIKRSGNNSVKLSKTNSFGYVQMTTKNPVRVEAGKMFTLRFWFNSSNAQVTSFLVPRLVADNNALTVANPDEALWVAYDYDV